MKQAAKACQGMTVGYIEMVMNSEVTHYRLPPVDFLDEPQDTRGLPMSYCREEDRRYRNHPTCCTAIFMEFINYIFEMIKEDTKKFEQEK